MKLITNEVKTLEEGKALAWSLLEGLGIQRNRIDQASKIISQHSNIRGAILIDIHSGKPMDNREEKGVRVSRMDWLGNQYEKWAHYYNTPLNSRIREALALATKVCVHRATIAELCWSDDPDYITGYVASERLGYQRITKLKEYGDERGCRVFLLTQKKVYPLTYII